MNVNDFTYQFSKKLDGAYILRRKRFCPKARWVLHGEATTSREINGNEAVNGGWPSCEGTEEGSSSVSYPKSLVASPRNPEIALGKNRLAMPTIDSIPGLY